MWGVWQWKWQLCRNRKETKRSLYIYYSIWGTKGTLLFTKGFHIFTIQAFLACQVTIYLSLGILFGTIHHIACSCCRTQLHMGGSMDNSCNKKLIFRNSFTMSIQLCLQLLFFMLSKDRILTLIFCWRTFTYSTISSSMSAVFACY